MADGLPYTRQQLKDWCLRKLGAPVIEINVDDDQVEDRISEGLAYFRDYHFDGIEKILFKHKITASCLFFSAAITGTFLPGEKIEGQTSGAIAYIVDQATDNLGVRIQFITGTFQPNEVVLGEESGASATISTAANSIVIGDIDNKSIPTGPEIIAVTDILPFKSTLTTYGVFSYGGGGMWDFQYQFAQANMPSLINSDFISYSMFRRQMSFLQLEFQGYTGFRFNRKTDRIYIDTQWGTDIQVDEYVVFICYKALDPEAYKEVYSDLFVREYCYNLLKQQWGTNLKKYSGIALPGSVTFNGQTLYEEATKDLEKLENRIRTEWQEPVDFLVG